ncbi:MAG TPA: CoA-transferase [Kofleriaceae bacterium]|nr:CoA-transferase [Kofleriaceae bacterium]
MTIAIAERDPAVRAPVPATSAADRLIWRMAGEIADGAVVATGVASPLAVLAIALARATHAPRLTYLACVGSLNPAVSRLLGSSEDLAYLTGRSGEVTIPDLFDHARRGRVDNIFFGAAEVDGAGRTNLSATGSLAQPGVKFPGVAGACTLRRWCRHPVLVVPRQSKRSLVARVAIRSTEDAARRTWLLTDLATFTVGGTAAATEAAPEVEPEAVLEAIEPRVALDHVRARTGFGYVVAAAFHALPDPPASAVDTLHSLDPAGLRGELVGAAP